MSRATSPTRTSMDLTASDKSNIAEPNAEEAQNLLSQENNNLRKQMRQVEAESKMTKAVLEQKIELLESQIAEFHGREDNLKKMNETIMLALTDINNKGHNPLANKAAKELELATEHHDKEMQEYRNRTNELIKNLETENKKLKESSAENEIRLKEFSLHFEKAQMGFNQALNDLEQERTSLENKIKRMEEDKQQSRELGDYETLVKINELKMNSERLKDEYKKELHKAKESYEKNIQELKSAFENEKKVLETKLEKTQDVLTKESTKRENGSAELQSKYQKEVQNLKDHLKQITNENIKEVNELTRQRDEANEKIEKLEAQVKKLKTGLKSSQSLQEQNSKLLKEKLDKAKSVMEHGETLVEENKKHKQKISELKTHIKKLETSEQRLKEQFQEKENKNDEERIDIKKRLSFEEKVLNKSVQEALLSQSNLQGKHLRQSVGSNASGDSHSKSTMKNSPFIGSNSVTLPKATERLSVNYSDFSPLKDISLVNVETDNNESKKQERSTSSNVSTLPSKNLKLSPEEPVSQKSGSSTKLAESTERKYQAPATMDTIEDDSKSDRDNAMPNSAVTVHRKAPLETSFADHGFTIENDLDALRTETSRIEKARANKEKRFSRQIDVDTIPINYSEFVKRTQRSKMLADSQSSEPELPTQADAEPKTETIESGTGPQIFFTTTQDENQPLFGTSHFVFEGTKDMHVDELGSDSSRINVKTIENKKEKLDRDREIERQYEREAVAMENDVDIVDIGDVSDVGDVVNLGNVGRFSMNLHRKGSSSKSCTKEDFETRPSLINPLHSVYDSTSMDVFQDPQASVDFLSGNAKSVIDRDRDRERERERIFSTRCSLSASAYGGGNGATANSNNGSRQKIEGRLKELEWKLKEMELKNQGLRVEKDKVQFEFEKLMVELKEKKAESEVIKNSTSGVWDEKKQEKEAALKNEIKFLINKLLKVKNKLEKQSEELNVTKSSNILGQSQVNFSMNGSQLLGKKDYSREYGTLGGLNNMSLANQIRERENWNPMHSQSITLSTHNMPSMQSMQKSMNADSWGGPSHLNTSAAKPENYRISERGNAKSSLGVAIENFAKNVRSKSNARYDHNRESQNASINQYSGIKANEQSMSSYVTTRTHRTKTPNLPRPEDLNGSIGSVLPREVLKNNINMQNYEPTHANSNYDTSNYLLYQRKSTR